MDAGSNVFACGYTGAEGVVVKFSPAGVLLWQVKLGVVLNALAVDQASGDVVVTGNLGSGDKDLIVAKLAAGTGATLWSRTLAAQWGVENTDIGYGVAIDPRNGDIVLVGQISGWVSINGAWVFPNSSSPSIWFSKLNSSGAWLWAKAMTTPGGAHATAVNVDATGGIVAAGIASGLLDLGGGTVTDGGTFPDAWCAKFNSNGGHLWSRGFGNTLLTMASGVAVDSTGNVALTGYFSQTVNFGSGNLTATNTSGYVLKLSAATGATTWAKLLAATQTCSGNAVTFDAAGNVLVTGSFYRTANFTGNTLDAPSNTHEGFLAKFTGSGAPIDSQRFGGIGDDRGFALAPGLIGGTTGGGSFGATNVVSAGNDGFVYRLP
jgi:hypothetical protein